LQVPVVKYFGTFRKVYHCNLEEKANY